MTLIFGLLVFTYLGPCVTPLRFLLTLVLEISALAESGFFLGPNLCHYYLVPCHCLHHKRLVGVHNIKNELAILNFDYRSGEHSQLLILIRIPIH